MGVGMDVIEALYECAAKAAPAAIKVGYEARMALLADPDIVQCWNGPDVFQGVPVKSLPPQELALTAWMVVPGACHYCRGRGRVLLPFLPSEPEINDPVPADFGSKVCPDCGGKPLPPITGAV